MLKYKLPNLKKKRITIKQDNNINIDNLKLKSNDSNSTLNNRIINNISKTPIGLRHIITFNKSEKKVGTISNIENQRDEYDLIKQFLYQKINYKKYLKPIKILTKSNSSNNLKKNKYSYFFIENDEKEIAENKTNNMNNNMTFLLFNKFNRVFNRNRNINQINNINKYLIKNNENETNKRKFSI